MMAVALTRRVSAFTVELVTGATDEQSLLYVAPGFRVEDMWTGAPSCR